MISLLITKNRKKDRSVYVYVCVCVYVEKYVRRGGIASFSTGETIIRPARGVELFVKVAYRSAVKCGAYISVYIDRPKYIEADY